MYEKLTLPNRNNIRDEKKWLGYAEKFGGIS